MYRKWPSKYMHVHVGPLYIISKRYWGETILSPHNPGEYWGESPCCPCGVGAYDLKETNIQKLPGLVTQSALEFFPIHCPNGRLGQDLGFGGFAFALKLPELLNRKLAAVRAKLGQTSCFPNGPQIWCPIGQLIGFPAGANEHNQALP